jgi:hypothetical protein
VFLYIVLVLLLVLVLDLVRCVLSASMNRRTSRARVYLKA